MEKAQVYSQFPWLLESSYMSSKCKIEPKDIRVLTLGMKSTCDIGHFDFSFPATNTLCHMFSSDSSCLNIFGVLSMFSSNSFKAATFFTERCLMKTMYVRLYGSGALYKSI